MAICTDILTKKIISDCSTTPIGGVETLAWIGYRKNVLATFDVTNPSKVTLLEMLNGTKLYEMKGVKKLFNPAFSRVVATDRPDTFIHKFNFQGFEFDAASVENFDSLQDVFVIFEMVDKTNPIDGGFRIAGLTHGMYPTSDEWTANDIDGARAFSVETMEGQGERYSQWTLTGADRDAIITMLDGLVNPT